MAHQMTDDELLATLRQFPSPDLTEAQLKRRQLAADRRRTERRRLQRYTPDGSKSGTPLDHVYFDIIHIPATRRPINEARVAELMASISQVGLLHPPIVTLRDDIPDEDGDECAGTPVLVAGRHRLEAMLRLGYDGVDVIVLKIDDVEAELIEITENLHRAELTALERDVQIARWIVLTGAKPAENIAAQIAPKLGRPEAGINAASRELGIERTDAQRAVKVASLSPEAKAIAAEVGLDNNRSALLSAAKEPTPELQVAKVKEWGTKRDLGIAKRAVARSAAAEQVEAPANGFDDGDREQAHGGMIADMTCEQRSAHFASLPKPSLLSKAVIAYDALPPDERLAFHEQRPDPTRSCVSNLPQHLLVKIPQLAA